jgi:transcriptional regulator with XRE-family HTH domain
MAARPWVKSVAYEAAITAIVGYRKSLGLTQRELAARLGKPQSFVSKIESRERRLDIVEFIAIARAFGVGEDELIAAVAKAVGADIDV